MLRNPEHVKQNVIPVVYMKTLSRATRKINLEIGNRGYSSEKEGKSFKQAIFTDIFRLLTPYQSNDGFCSVGDNACLSVVFVISWVQVFVGRVALINKYIQNKR